MKTSPLTVGNLPACYSSLACDGAELEDISYSIGPKADGSDPDSLDAIAFQSGKITFMSILSQSPQLQGQSEAKIMQ